MTDVEAIVQRYYGDRPVCNGLTTRSVPLEWIPRGPAIAICGRSTSCTAGASWQRASMRNVRAYRPACTCSISVAASAAHPAISRPDAVAGWQRLTSRARAVARPGAGLSALIGATTGDCAPYPAVVVLHGCGGISSHSAVRQERTEPFERRQGAKEIERKTGLGRTAAGVGYYGVDPPPGETRHAPDERRTASVVVRSATTSAS